VFVNFSALIAILCFCLLPVLVLSVTTADEQETVAGLHYLAFVILMLKNGAEILA
jgi:hypothetical protein